jgi:hypothetical protein
MVGLTFEMDDFSAVQDTVDHGNHTARTGEDIRPFCEGPIGGEQGTFGLITLVDELEEQVPHSGVIG